jgi:hypothetical protein
LAWTPEFTPDNYLTGERFVFYSSESQSIIAPANKFKVEQTKNAQWATRIATNHNSVEYALYGYKGYWTTPQGINSNNTSYFPKLNSWGASVRMPLGKGLFNSEYVYYQSAENKKGKSRNIAHSQSRFLIGYEQELMKHLTFSFQYYVEKTHDYKKLTSQQTTAPIIDEYRQLLTTRFTYSAMQQKLIYSLFSFYSPTDQDAYIRPSVQFRQNDQWSFAIGANLFKGKNNYSFFGQHQDNSNAWARIRFQY